MFLQTVFEEGGLLEVRVAKDVLSENLPLFEGELYALTERPGLTLALDFEGVAQLCSRALGVLAVASWRLQKNGGSLTVANLNPNLQRIFRYARLDRSMGMVESLPAASKSVRAVAA